MMQLQVKRMTATAVLPRYAHETDAGLDIYADETVMLPLQESVLVRTGIAVAIPQGCEGQLRPRSGLAKDYGVTILNAPGTIDAGYRGELGVLLHNTTDRPFLVEKGHRIAQLVIAPVIRAEIEEVTELDATTRGECGFGSTGK